MEHMMQIDNKIVPMLRVPSDLQDAIGSNHSNKITSAKKHEVYHDLEHKAVTEFFKKSEDPMEMRYFVYKEVAFSVKGFPIY